jgi:hypothetical protein
VPFTLCAAEIEANINLEILFPARSFAAREIQVHTEVVPCSSHLNSFNLAVDHHPTERPWKVALELLNDQCIILLTGSSQTNLSTVHK